MITEMILVFAQQPEKKSSSLHLQPTCGGECGDAITSYPVKNEPKDHKIRNRQIPSHRLSSFISASSSRQKSLAKKTNQINSKAAPKAQEKIVLLELFLMFFFRKSGLSGELNSNMRP